MPTIKFISHEGLDHEVYAESGTSLMDIAVDNGVAGIAAECGGACSCATCHIYIDPAWIAQLPGPDDAELELLEFAVDLKENSRLSCQIEITEEFDGLVVRTPESQY